MSFGRGYNRYVLATLTLVYTLNFVDRGLIILLLQPIKEDLRLTDTQLGFLTGIAFGLFYATVGIPIARWADRGNRVTITALAIGLWGMTVMSCLVVSNFLQMVFARIAAAVGEAGCKPPTYSLVGDYFPGAAQRPRAMAIYWLANPLSALISLLAGGWLNELYGWRMTFFLMGVPALLVAAIVKLTIKEPRTDPAGARGPVRETPRIAAVLSALWQQPSSRHLSLAVILFYTMSYGLAPWYAAFLIRSHGMMINELGMWLGLIFGVAGIVGILSGGHVAGRWLASDERGQMSMIALTVAALLPGYVLFLLLPHRYQALGMLVPLAIAINFILGPTYALMQRLVPDEMRATALSVVMLFANLIGMGLGAQAVGLTSDALMQMLGQDSLRYAMLIISFVALWSAYHFWRAGRSVAADLARMKSPAPVTFAPHLPIQARP
jgi:predicted MFS family arabinose efflux permease